MTKGDSMTEHDQTPDTAPEWNPLAEITPERIPLETSGGRAAIVCAPWSGRERLAYEDALTERMLTEDEDGGSTVKIGTLRLFAASLTVRGSEGFPVEGFLEGDRAKREADLLSITHGPTYREIMRHATRVQPLPSAGGDEPEGEEDGEDPFPTLPTPPTQTGDAPA